MPVGGLYISLFLCKRVPQSFLSLKAFNAARPPDVASTHLGRLPVIHFV